MEENDEEKKYILPDFLAKKEQSYPTLREGE